MSGQLSLFGEAGEPATEIVAHVTDDDRAVAARVPSWIHFGTSSWSFPGWTGIVWKGRHDAEALARSGLRAYAQHPLFRAVGIDRSYYGPLRASEIATYAAQVDEAAALTPSLPSCRFLSKAWEEISTAVFPAHPRYGARAGQRNPMFLDAGRFVSEVLEPYRAHARHLGPFVFELTPMPTGTFDERTFTTKLGAFLAALPTGFQWAFELRNQELMTPRWHDVLHAYGAAHVFNYWTAMPSIRAQLARQRRFSSRFVVARLMLPPFTRYADKRLEYAPFDRLVTPQPDMRDDVIALLRAARDAGCEDAFVVAGNKAEGSAPLTARALAERAARELS